jgi:hypothetical protein
MGSGKTSKAYQRTFGSRAALGGAYEKDKFQNSE